MEPVKIYEKLISECRHLRIHHQFIESFRKIENKLIKFPQDEKLNQLHFEYHPCWLTPIEAGHCRLTRRTEGDEDFIKFLYSDPIFLKKFNRNIEPINYFDNLKERLRFELTATISEYNSVFWIIRDHNSNPWGIIGLTDISLGNKRAEILCGVLNNSPITIAVSANLLLFHFFFNIIQFNKIIAFTYTDNPKATSNSIKIGFQQEGFFKNHVWSPQEKKYIDLYQLGLLKDSAFSINNMKIIRKLLPDLYSKLLSSGHFKGVD
jgi:RimJ/RimL family protein N-acetyltransferase